MEHSFTPFVPTAQPSNAHLTKQCPEQPQAPSKDLLKPHLFHLCAWYKASICRSGQISCPPELCSSFTRKHVQQRWAPHAVNAVMPIHQLLILISIYWGIQLQRRIQSSVKRHLLGFQRHGLSTAYVCIPCTHSNTCINKCKNARQYYRSVCVAGHVQIQKKISL